MLMDRCNNWFDDENRCNCNCKKIIVVTIGALLVAMYVIVAGREAVVVVGRVIVVVRQSIVAVGHLIVVDSIISTI